MISTNLMPVTTGTPALGTAPVGSWLTCDLPSSYQRSTVAPNHVQIAGVVPAAAAFAARPAVGNAVVGTDAARKRGRPPRGEPR